ncbi:MAG: ATP-dependent DNA helicase RecG [Pseudanabaenaceae cyanobacterium SKYGB_i_bin29]|nr:ATP-dependent DNA helicase RecG [Pseudanabaenaceae cyanobacterium SKYG29]MDW8420856.1 ATP-dependent DNA helicase RecG [Pseudanabaenaceae cyanobacterium SKYGB_i_bin29]
MLARDIIKLQEALEVESRYGCRNLRGKTAYFADFLSNSLIEHFADREQALKLARNYQQYNSFSLAQRQNLIAETKQFLYEIRRQQLTTPPIKEKEKTSKSTIEHLTLQTTLEAWQGPRGKRWQKLGLQTIGDVLHYYPRDHVDYAKQIPIRELQENETVTIIGQIRRFSCFTSPKNPHLTIMEVLVRDSTGQIKLQRFWTGKRYTTQAWQGQLRKMYPIGATIAAAGVVKKGKYGLSLEDFEVEILDHSNDQIESERVGRLVPVYSLTEGITPAQIRQLVIECLPLADQIVDPLPLQLREQYQLLSLQNAIKFIHYPPDREKLELAIYRLTFDKYFFRRLIALYRQQQQTSPALVATGQLIAQFDRIIPFPLTNAQKRVIQEIHQDLQKTKPMNRLVQGDVGSGKTIVAVYAILLAIETGWQTALMAPTEVLVEQHYRKIVPWFSQLALPVELLTSSTKASKRKEILRQLSTGELPLVIGTHALIQEDVEFQRLGLVIIDEQHRFGTDQRLKLVKKGESPHVMIMTATPIPRTLYLTNSEIDVSIIDELPPGRKPIQTVLIRPSQRRYAYDLIKREVVQGRQCYVVLPLVAESEKLEDVKAAVQEWERLQEQIFPNFRVGLLHGQMTAAEKDKAITDFRDHKTDILVATTVVEVGVDVPNASVMLIEHSDRFGLAQLHQLRGRVGRGADQAYCLLCTDTNSEVALARLQVLVQSQDGFYIAERDYEMRGKGKDEGKEQSGHSGFTIDDRIKDSTLRQQIYVRSREAAQLVLQTDPTLASFPALKQAFAYHYDRLQGGAIFT